MVPISRLALFLFLSVLAPVIALSQTFEVHAPFDPANYKPLSAHERLQRWWNEDGATASIHVQSISSALYLQVINDPTVWKRDGGGILRRVGSSYGVNLMQNSMHETLAGVERTDPRYFACECNGFFRRSGHALKMTFLTYNYTGRETLDVPQLFSAYGSTMIETTWWPHHYSALVQGVQTGHIEIGFIGAEHLIQEFSPEFKRLLHLRRDSAQTKP